MITLKTAARRIRPLSGADRRTGLPMVLQEALSRSRHPQGEWHLAE